MITAVKIFIDESTNWDHDEEDENTKNHSPTLLTSFFNSSGNSLNKELAELIGVLSITILEHSNENQLLETYTIK